MNNNSTVTSQYPEISSEDLCKWWDEFQVIIRQCFTSNRIDLETSSGQSQDSLHDWCYSSAADILTNSGIQCREKVIAFICSDSPHGISVLMQSMEKISTSGSKKAEVISKILRETANPKNGKLRSIVIRQAIAANYLQFSVKVLKDLIKLRPKTKTHDPNENVELTITNMLWFLSAVSSNDSGFAKKVRQMLKVKFFHHDLIKKSFFGKSLAHYPLLKILRQLSKDPNVSQTLGKEGIMSTIRKIFTSLPNQPGGKLLILVDALSYLTKDKTNCTKLLKAGLVSKLMRCFSHWESWKGKGLLRLTKFLIVIYSRVGVTKPGRKILKQCDVILHFRKFCDQCPSEKSFDDVIMKIASMVALVYEKDQLPLENLTSPIRFRIPELDKLNKSNYSGSSSDDEGSESDNEGDLGSEDIGIADEDDDDNDSNDDERHISEDENDTIDNLQKITNTEFEASTDPTQISRRESTGSGAMILPASPASMDKLVKYHSLFEEINKDTLQLQGKGESKNIKPLKKIGSIVDENFNETGDVSKTENSNIPSSKHSYSFLKDNLENKYWDSIYDLRCQYSKIANSLKHAAPFIKLPYPEIAFGYSQRSCENMLSTADRGVMRNKIASYIQRIVGISYKPKEAYSLDNLIKQMSKDALIKEQEILNNTDEKEVGRYERKYGLLFESRFESGNLRKAIQVGDREYDLMITSDVNSSQHNQWFYFQLSNICDELVYTFNIINCTKSNSLFNYGMQPVVFSVTDAMNGKAGWTRSGSNICYYKNGYKYASKKRNSSRVYHTLSFSLTFSHKGDIVYVAYHIPYTYSRLMVELSAMTKAVDNRNDLLMRCESLCQSINKNDVPMITITASKERDIPVNKRQIIIITSRVHPGETNASWVMKGALEFLLFGSNAKIWLGKFIFKIVPMLNVEGVINGCHRCGLTSEDLNRCWKFPSETLHPTIFHTKMLIEYCCRVLKKPPITYIDLHGHSRRKNVFFYGCSLVKSWNHQDKENSSKEDPDILRTIPDSMDTISNAFCINYCNYDVRKSRETTARVAVWRDYDILRSYTLECSYCGCDRGVYKGTAFGTNHLMEIGKNLCQALKNL